MVVPQRASIKSTSVFFNFDLDYLFQSIRIGFCTILRVVVEQSKGTESSAINGLRVHLKNTHFT